MQGGLPPPSGLSQSSSSSTNSANASMTGIAPSQRVTPLSGPMANSNAFKLDLAKISKGQDKRTTFMIRNIPNKYTQEMIRSWIDTTHKGTYDFLYLPIDFENKCNIGYAFINFMEPRFVVTFAQTRLGKHWAQFNSEKKCDLAYARLQGKASLIQRFRNSDIMQQDVSYQPILFHSSGPNKGMPEEFPRRQSNHH
ncbi:RNA recognition motif 2-domain-containing protein [Gongronella butleri]|nr:RNA recognition motif 2-domain-containing protein [Gongronella butleri]